MTTQSARSKLTMGWLGLLATMIALVIVLAGFPAGAEPDRKVLPSRRLVATTRPGPSSQPARSPKPLADWHRANQTEFANAQGFGPVRLTRMLIRRPSATQPNATAAPDLHRIYLGTGLGDTVADGRSFVAQRFELIGLLKEGSPRAYVSSNRPEKKDLKKNNTRELTAIETDALKQFRAGEELVVKFADRDDPWPETIAIGALRADDSCIKCHAVEKGTLLGAFSYGLWLASER